MTAIVKHITVVTLVAVVSHASAHFSQSWYAGLLAGYGSTNWSKIKTDDPTLQNSLPSHADDSGLAWGAFIGDNINSHYGLELRYQHYANSKISFAKFNEYAPPPSFPAFTMSSSSYNIAFLGKLRVQPTPHVELYSLLGLSYTHRQDKLVTLDGLGGFFGAGTRFMVNKHFSLGPEFDFVTGNEKVTLSPAKTYLPFLTSINLKVQYVF
jgi:hypothetical protein